MPPKLMREVLLASAAALVCVSALSATPPAAQGHSADVPAGYRLVWADEFDAEGLPDPRKWAHDTGMNKQGWHNKELQYYSAPRAENAVVRGGRLIITARKESMTKSPDWGGQRYTSARLLTRGLADWTFGFFEVRAKLPCGKGTWPAIWMLGSEGEWPARGELDIMEHFGRIPDIVSSAVHTTASHGAYPVTGWAPVANACRTFHRYQMHWTADNITFGVDGRAYMRYARLDGGERVWPFDRPEFLLLNVAIGGDGAGPVDDAIFPVAMEIDYVRVYQKSRP